MAGSVVRIAALGDLHCTKESDGVFQPLFTHIADVADMLLLAGDLTDFGLPDEARMLARELEAVRVPVAAVLGNHDFESGKADDVRRILTDVGVQVLDGGACEIGGVGIAGVKGFGGGFGLGALRPWGENTMKGFAREAADEALKLEQALAGLHTKWRVALMHYAPIADTVEGELPEIYAFLGSSRLEQPLNQYPVSLVVHAHAHRGRSDGATKTGVPVYNVSMPLLGRVFANRQPFRLFELSLAESTRSTHPPSASPPRMPVPVS